MFSAEPSYSAFPLDTLAWFIGAMRDCTPDVPSLDISCRVLRSSVDIASCVLDRSAGEAE